jgi:hypothetical protein
MVYGDEQQRQQQQQQQQQQQAAAALWYLQCVLWLRIFYFYEYVNQVRICRGQLNTRSGLHVQCVYAVMCVMVAVAVHM